MIVNKDGFQAVSTMGKQIPPLMGSLVRDGRTQSPTITVSPMWEITTFVGILIGTQRRGATP